jgi:release factor glutamine methyltransferase
MTSMRAAIDEATQALLAAGVGTPRVDAEYLAAHTAGVERGRLAFSEPDESFLDRYRHAVDARAQRIPLQHLTASAAFGPVTVTVGPGVFIPRPETESMLEWALAQPIPASEGWSGATRESTRPLIVDLCTGSGALALAIARARPDARVVAVDDSADALTYARRNLEGTGVELVDGDVTAADALTDLDGAVDLVVANPPYIPDGSELEPEVAQHDPAHALFGGPDGMTVIAPMVALIGRLLRRGGLVAVEHDDTTASQTLALFERAGGFADIVSRRDLAGRPRFVTAMRSEVN